MAGELKGHPLRRLTFSVDTEKWKRKCCPLPIQSPWSDLQGGARCHMHPDPAAPHPPLRGTCAFPRKSGTCSRSPGGGSSRSPGPRALPAHQPASKPAESATFTHTPSAFPGLPFLNGHINYCPFFLVIIWNTFFFFFPGFSFSLRLLQK